MSNIDGRAADMQDKMQQLINEAHSLPINSTAYHVSQEPASIYPYIFGSVYPQPDRYWLNGMSNKIYQDIEIGDWVIAQLSTI